MIRARGTLRRTLVGALAAGFLVCSGCSPGESEPGDERRVHAEGDGPLSVGQGGENSILAPKKSPWTATFGWVQPCSSTGEAITIEKVHYDFAPEPRAARTLAYRPASGTTPFGSTKGTPEDQLRSDSHMRGELVESVEGLEIDDQCGTSQQQSGLQLLTVLDVGEGGAEVRDYRIDYTSQGQEYTLTVDWRLIACGTETPADYC